MDRSAITSISLRRACAALGLLAATAAATVAACGGGSNANTASNMTSTASAGGAQSTPSDDAGATASADADTTTGATAPSTPSTPETGPEPATAEADAGAPAVPAERPWEGASPEIVARIQPLYPAFRRCFAAARDVASATHSSFVLNLDAEPSGHVREVHAIFTASVPEARARGVIRCLETRARTLSLPASEAGSRTQSLHSLEGGG